MRRLAKTVTRRAMAIAGFFLALAMTPFHRLPACGLDWRFPTNHFDGVNAQGYVAYWEKVADVDFGEGLKLPMVIGFRSNTENGRPSPYLGSGGWILPLLEASMVQTSEDSFVMMQPDGWNNLFLRKDDSVLNGSAGWMAQINGDSITAWAKCGWKLEFYKGHIVSMTTPKNRKFEYVYSGNTITEIRENGVARLTTEQDSHGDTTAFVFNDRRLEIALDRKPQVQNIGRQNVVAGMDESLRSIAPSDSPSKSFEFAVNDKVQPTLKITSKTGQERLFTWDAATKRIISDGDWIYTIKNPGGSTEPAEIARRSDRTKQGEYWFYNGAKGEETTKGVNNVEIVQSWFTSGPVAGKCRKIEEIRGQNRITVYRPTYDEFGRLFRVFDRGSVRTFCYDSHGVLSYHTDGGPEITFPR